MLNKEEYKFRDFLIKNQIEFEDKGEGIVVVDDNLLRPYEQQLKELLPEIEFIWNVIPKERI